MGEENQENPEMIRCFIALELPREAINEIEELQKIIKKKNLFYGKMTDGENLHLTLKFLGEISEEKIEKIRKKLSEIKFSKFSASLGEIGFFSKEFIRILWIKLNGKPIWDLQNEVDKKLEELSLGFKKEERFMSHVTIARIKKVPDKKAFFDYIKNLKHREIKFDVKEFLLKKSELRPEGPVYIDIDKYSFQG
jgi:2'-5' RNA ligase